MISSSVVDPEPELFWSGLIRNNCTQSGSDLDKNFFYNFCLLIFIKMVQFVFDFIHFSLIKLLNAWKFLQQSRYVHLKLDNNLVGFV
jgi:hypothetical protein